MYLSFYHFKHKPFQISTDPRFLWLGEKHEEALATLKYGVLDNKGFLLLTGDVGTGKTTLINALLRTLDDDTFVAFIRDPALDPLDFFQYTAHAFGMKASTISSKVSFLIQFEEFLLDAFENRRKVLLIIDEAQRMSQELLEEVRLLSNIEREDSKLLNIFFVGQIEFNDIIHLPENRAIRQRITISYNIDELTEEETKQYIKHRMEIASTNDDIGFFAPIQKKSNGEYVKQGFRLPLPEVREEIFTADAIKEVYAFSKGYPRLINIICDRALLTGFVEESKTVTRKHVLECAKELEIPHKKEPPPQQQQTDTSLKNSLERLNREFEEIRNREKLQQEKAEDSPRDLIKRLEEADKTVVDQEEQMTVDQPPPKPEETPEDYDFRKEQPLTEDPDPEVTQEEPETTAPVEGVAEEDQPETIAGEVEPPTTEFPDKEDESKQPLSAPSQNTKEILDKLAALADEENEQQYGPYSASETTATLREEHPAQPQSRRRFAPFLLLALLLLAALYIYSDDLPFQIPQLQEKPGKALDDAQMNDQQINESTSTDSHQVINDGSLAAKKDTPPTDSAKKKNLVDSEEKSLQKQPLATPTKEKTKPLFIGKDKSVKYPNGRKKDHQSTLSDINTPDATTVSANANNIETKIRQLKSLITFESLIIGFPENSNLPPVDTLDKLNSLVDSLLTHPSFNVVLTHYTETGGDNPEGGPILDFSVNAIQSYLTGRGLEHSRILVRPVPKALMPPQLKRNPDFQEGSRWVVVDVQR